MPTFFCKRLQHLLSHILVTTAGMTGTCGMLTAQNLVPNPSFEIYTSCPTMLGIGGPLEAIPWVSPPFVGTADYFNVCADPNTIGIPRNFQGWQNANTGGAYTGMYYKVIGSTYREYIQTQLLQPLEDGVCYKVSYYQNLSNTISCAVDRTGALLSENGIANPLGMIPQVNWGGQFFSDTLNWTYIYGYVMGTGVEEYITIGNFYGDGQTTWDPDCQNNLFYSYYYIDDVVIEAVPIEDILFELDGPVSVCDSYTIDPDITQDGVLFHWSTGEQSPTITVTTSGTYSLTVEYGCTFTEDEIEVTVFDPDPVDMGPPSFILCTGETYTISLDPSYGQYEWSDGSTGPDFDITTSGTYMVTLDDGCDITSDQMVVSLLDPPLPFTLGDDSYVCPGDEIEYDFDPALGDFQWQDGSSTSSYAIDEAGTYALTISNQCGEESDEIEIVAIEPPFFNLGPDSAIICSGDFLDINLDPTLGDFFWQDGSSEPYYQITTPGLYSLTVSNECGVENDNIYVGQLITPLIDLGPSMQACNGDTITLSTGNITDTIMWQDGSSSTTYQVTTSGMYAVTVSNECGMDTDSITITYNPQLTPPDLGPDISLCPGQQAVLTPNITSATYLWNDMSTADTLLITSAGTYYVQAYNYCSTYSDTIVVTLNNQPPTLSLPADFALCQGQSVTLDANVAGVDYIWNDGTMLSQITVSSPGVYVLTVSNSCGSDVDSVEVIDGGQAPLVELGIDTAICPGSSLTITPSFSNVDVWEWQDGSTNTFFQANTAGQINVQVGNGCGAAYDTMMIGLLADIPLLSLGPDTAICPGSSITLSIAVPEVDILWSDGSFNPDLTISDSMIVMATISNTCGMAVDAIQIDLLPDAPMLQLGPDQTICPGEVIVLDPGIVGVSYLWQDGSTSPQLNITQQGLVILTVFNECGSDTDSLAITESTNGPQLDLGPDLVACEGAIISIPANLGGVDYLWQDGSTDDIYIATASGTYILEVSNLCGADRDTIVVDISGSSPLPQLGADTTLCAGNSLVLMSDADAITSIVWQDGSDMSTFMVTGPGLFTLSESNRCGDAVDSILVTYMDAPVPFDLGPDTTLCPGEFFIISAPATLYALQWQDGSSQPEMVADEAITYSLEISNACGVVSDNLIVDIDQDTPVLHPDATQTLCPGDIITFDATQSFAAMYVWSTGETTPSITVSTPGAYSVEVNTLCASSTQELEVVPSQNCGENTEIFIPNVFSPNEDNVNDVFTIYSGSDLVIANSKGTIYDRWGNLVYSSNALPFTWDGFFNGDIMMPGVYAYVMTVSYMVNGQEFEKVFSGDVTLIR